MSELNQSFHDHTSLNQPLVYAFGACGNLHMYINPSGLLFSSRDSVMTGIGLKAANGNEAFCSLAHVP